MRFLFLFLCFFLYNSKVSAQGSCYEPDYPNCLTSTFTFYDEVLFDSCKRELDYYREEVVDFGRCLGRWVDDTILALKQQAEETSAEATRLQDAAVSDYQDAVGYWNCKAANPDGYCYGP